jgi:hypothetical protein
MPIDGGAHHRSEVVVDEELAMRPPHSHVAASRSMRCSVSALTRLRFASHNASHLRAAPAKFPFLCSDTIIHAPLSFCRRMRARSSHARHAVAERPLTHHSSLSRAPHQETMKTGGKEERNEARVSPPPLRHTVLSIRETLSVVHLGSMTQIMPL